MKINRLFIIISSIVMILTMSSCSKGGNSEVEENNKQASANHSDEFVKIKGDNDNTSSEQTLADKLGEEQYWEHIDNEDINPEDVVMATAEVKLNSIDDYIDSGADITRSVNQGSYSPMTWMKFTEYGQDGSLMAQALAQACDENGWDSVNFEFGTGVENTDDWLYTIYTFSDETNIIKIATDNNGTVKYKCISENN